MTKYLANSLSHNSATSTFPYIHFPSKMQYSYRNSLVVIPKYTMPSGRSMHISTSILGFKNASSMSHSSATHTSSSLYRVSPIRIIVEVSDATGENYTMNLANGTRMHHFTTFIESIIINLSVSSFLINTQLTGNGFLNLSFTAFFFVRIQAFLDENNSLLISQTFFTHFHLASSLLTWGSQIPQSM